MAARLEEGHSELHKLLSQASAVPDPLLNVPPGLDSRTLNDQIKQIGRLVDDIGGRVAQGRAQQCETEVVSTRSAMEEAVAAMRVELNGVAQQFARAAATAAPKTAQADPWFGQNLGQPSSTATEYHHVGTAPGSPAGEQESNEAPLCGMGIPWPLYEEKWVLTCEGKCKSSKPLTWLKEPRNYLAGHCSDMDPLLEWFERHEDESDDSLIGLAPMVNHAPSLKEVPKQLWALLGHLVKSDSTVAGNYANVARHNSFEACRKFAEPIIEDRAMVRKALLTKVTNPEAAG